jgi:hypothetical protein
MKTQLTSSAVLGGASKSSSAPAVVNASAPGELSTRLERIRGWHGIATAQAWKLKLMVFFAGMEIQGLKAALGVTQGARSDAEELRKRVSEVSKGKADSWDEWVEIECGITSRTVRNYVAAYQSICQAAPKVVERILAIAAPRIDTAQPLALPDPEAVMATIPQAELAAFRDATDPWTLSELYARPLKAAQAQHLEETAKAASKKIEQQTMLKFWFDDFDGKVRTKSHLRLPRPQREMLLNTLEVTIKELRDSLRSK